MSIHSSKKGIIFTGLLMLTTSDRYPYSDPGNHQFNIRNCVKVVVDAYNGSVDFYIADTQDPIISSKKISFLDYSNLWILCQQS